MADLTSYQKELNDYDTFVEYSCLVDHSDLPSEVEKEEQYSRNLIYGCLFVFIITSYLLWESFKKHKWIRNPVRGNSENRQTYCYLSLSILECAMVLLCLGLIDLSLKIILLSSGNNFKH